MMHGYLVLIKRCLREFSKLVNERIFDHIKTLNRARGGPNLATYVRCTDDRTCNAI